MSLENFQKLQWKVLNKEGSPKQRKEFLASYKKITLLEGEIVTANEWVSKICKLEEKLSLAEEEIGNWKRKFQDLEKEKKLFEEMLKEKDQHQSCKEESALMRKNIKQLENDQFK